MSKMEIKTEGYAVVEKLAKKSGHSGHVIIPQEWIGKMVMVILKEPLDGD